MPKFKLKSKYKPAGDQIQAIDLLVKGLNAEVKHQTLLGVTGSGKTFTMANIVEQVQKPILVLAHNKTLAAQLYSEFKTLFPENAVRYFVSYYDYYQPEAYLPRRDLYIEKVSDVNETIERYRNAATQSLLTRPDTLIVASVSCIYGLGNPDDYNDLSRVIKVGESYNRQKLLIHLSDMQYERSEYDFYSGLYRVRGDVIDIYLTYEEHAVRIEYFGDEIESIKVINPVSGEVIEKPSSFKIFPAKQFVTNYDRLKAVIPKIEEDMKNEVAAFTKAGKLLEAHRLESRVKFDIDMLRETGYCSGIENYSRYIDGRTPGSPPSTLLDYLPDDWLMFIDESHMSIPQARGMYNGDKARKETLVNYGFRLKAAMDNRPLQFKEFSQKIDQVIYVSATPNEYELDLSKQSAAQAGFTDHQGYVEQLIRPTGLLDPKIEVRPIDGKNKDKLKAALLQNKYNFMPYAGDVAETRNQIDDLLVEIQSTIAKGERILVTTLTKKMSEALTTYLKELDIKVQYIHSDVDTVERVEILKDLRLGKYDVLIGINLLREGLDLPEVSLVVILDADKEGFLRSRTSMVQTIGRAARHDQGRVIMYADKVTGSMKLAIDETMRRRDIQNKHNKKYGITPTTITKAITDLLERSKEEEQKKSDTTIDGLTKQGEGYNVMSKKEKKELLIEIETQMNIFADMLEFEKAADMRDLLNQLKQGT